jgi:hypothetical protein
MTQKQQVMPMVKAWPESASFKSPWQILVSCLKNLVSIPTGYQDESGFHFGEEPATMDTRSPQS